MKSYFFISLYRENAFVASDYLPVFATHFCAFVQKTGKVPRNECLICHFSFSQGKEYSKAASRALFHKFYWLAPFLPAGFRLCAEEVFCFWNLFSFCNNCKRNTFHPQTHEIAVFPHVFCTIYNQFCATCTETAVFLGYFTSLQNEKSFLK